MEWVSLGKIDEEKRLRKSEKEERRREGGKAY